MESRSVTGVQRGAGGSADLSPNPPSDLRHLTPRPVYTAIKRLPRRWRSGRRGSNPRPQAWEADPPVWPRLAGRAGRWRLAGYL